MSEYVNSREGHAYERPGEERTTPISEIPPKYRKKVPLPGGGHQIVDRRLTYNYNAGRGEMVECGSKDASTDHDDARRRKK